MSYRFFHISIKDDGAGYRKIAVKPHPDRRLGFAEGRIETRLGTLSMKWSYQPEGIRYDLTLPAGCEAEVTLPDGREMMLKGGSYTFMTEAED